ncbi:MAG: type II toxin-antitoxin system RelE/ParE family toxin [Flavobacteriaceae bacterium]|nr:type II toxin-antitoxin system RelE/ParE family toxin [Flavobacteriaceae bacterium]
MLPDKKIEVNWSRQAKGDLKNIFERIKGKTKSIESATNVRTDIIETSKNINFVEQYQVDEFLGEPFRRMVVRHFKIIYKIQSDTEIRILQIFDSYQHPKRLRKK